MLPHQHSEDNWRLWCRLCAKIDPQESVNVFMKNDQKVDTDINSKDGTDLYLNEAIQKYLWVTITSDEELPKIICTDCFSRVTSIVNFAESVSKVQQMYHMLIDAPPIDIQAIRMKFGLKDKKMEEILPVVQYLDMLEESTRKEMTALDPLAQPFVEIKKEETLTDQHLPSDEQTKKSYTNNASSKQKIQENEVMPLELSEKISCRKRKTKIFIDYEDSNDTKIAGTSNYVDVESDSPGRIPGSKPIYTCTKCSRKFTRLCTFHRHINRGHLTCPECPKIFLSEARLEQHLQLHIPIELRKIFSCPDCETKFSSLQAVQNHIKFIHLNECNFICDQCGKAVCTEQMLKDHKLSHTDEKPFECELCKKSFKCRRSLKKHTLLYHDNKIHICSECGLQLSSAATLRRHMLVHSDELKFKCDYFARSFKRSKALKMHLILHTGLKPYSCDFCNRTFANGSNCRKHKKIAHPEELAEQEAAGGTKPVPKNIPKLKALKAVTQTSNNLLPVISKSSGNFAYKKNKNHKKVDT